MFAYQGYLYRIANPTWWENDEPIDRAELLAEFDEMLAIQCTDGTWNYDPYLHGMANGMIFMKSLVDGQEPPYKEVDRYLDERYNCDDCGTRQATFDDTVDEEYEEGFNDAVREWESTLQDGGVFVEE